MAFRVTVCLKDIGDYSTFSEAFRIFFGKIKEMVKSGTSLQVLETTNFITHTELDAPMDFYTARDFAYDIGLLAGDGELQENVPEPPVEIVQFVFENIALGYKLFIQACVLEMIADLLDKAADTIEQL